MTPSWGRMLRGLWMDQRLRWALRDADRARAKWRLAVQRVQKLVARLERLP
ncbi:MAG: hypothetical protein ACK4WC_13435 [Rubrimonas sp.]